MGPSSLAAAVCMVVCAVASALPLAKFFSFRSSTAVDTKQGDTDEPKEEKDDVDEDNDEWGIIHAPHSVHSRPSRVQLATTVHDVQVSLALAVTVCRRSPPGLRVQQVRATWTFSAATGSTQRLRRGLQFVQAPMFAVHLVTLAQFEAYVADRLKFAVHRHSEFIMGSRLRWAPRLSIGAPAAIAGPVESSTTRSASSFDPPVENHHEQAAMKPARRPRARLTNIKPRYLNYEQSASYSTKRQENIERRRALQSSQHRRSKDPRCIS